MRPNHRALLSLVVAIALVVLAGDPTYAQLIGTDTAPGESCAGVPAGATRMTADADQNGAEVVLVCDGSVWQPAAGGLPSCADGQFPVMYGGVWTCSGGVNVGYQPACDPDDEGTIRYVSSGDPPWEYCDGADWVNFKQPRCQDHGTGACYLELDRSESDPDFIPENIVCGVNILGVVGVCGDCTLDSQHVPHGDSHTFYSETEHANCASVSQQRTCTDGILDGSASYQYASCEPPPPPQFVALNSVEGSGSTIVVTKPAGLAEGDYLIAFIGHTNEGNSTPPPGWATLGTQADDGFRTTIYGKLADTDDVAAASFSFSLPESTSDRLGAVAAYSGVSQTNPVDFVGRNETFGSTCNYLGGTITYPNSMIVAICESYHSDPNTPSGFTSRLERWGSRWSDRVEEDAGTLDGFSAGGGTTWTQAWTIVLSPN